MWYETRDDFNVPFRTYKMNTRQYVEWKEKKEKEEKFKKRVNTLTVVGVILAIAAWTFVLIV